MNTIQARIFVILFLVAAALFAQTENALSDGMMVNQLLKKDSLVARKFPVYTVNGEWQFSDKPNWLSGFNCGELWQMYELTGDERLKQRALNQAEFLLSYVALDNTHDMGFIFLPSLVSAYKHTGDVKFRDGAIRAARMLAKRFTVNGNFIRAWGKLGTDDREGLSIIDTMLNLELLFWAARETGDYSLYDIAYAHALTCLKQHVRPNFSSYHVVEFEPGSGDVIKKRTHQGFGDETTWARGQAWGIYGFAKAFQYTRDERFLNVAEKMADYFLAKLPVDYVPHWDLDLSSDTTQRDASAAAIAAQGCNLIASLTTSAEEFRHYRSWFNKIAESLIRSYSFISSSRPREQGLLTQTVYNFAKNWGIGESFPCGDYYFTEMYCDYRALSAQERFIVPDSKERVYSLNKDWLFLHDDIKNIDGLKTSPARWEHISLPHTWNALDVYDEVPGYRRGIGWYEKDVYFPKFSEGHHIVLSFEGVNTKATVYVNSVNAGEHIGGYVGFDIDITNFIKPDAQNKIQVKADNAVDIHVIPSQKSDFNIFGGITRNVRLKVFPETYIRRMQVSTPQVNARTGVATVTVDITGGAGSTGKHIFHLTVKNTAGVTVSQLREAVELKAGDNHFFFALPPVSAPNLWSPDTPYLYKVEGAIEKDKKIIAGRSEKFGFRWYEFKEKGAFYLNGERLFLRGTHRHEEISGYGNAIPDSLHRRDIEQIKELGANFIRLAHYPQAPEIYRACDELGLLVWDELPWCRGGMGDMEWQGHTKQLLKEQIAQNFNHPSIILWSVGNESDWVPDFPGGDNPDSLVKFARELHQICKELDPHRLTTTRKFEAAGKSVDVFSPSMWPGWYSEVYKNYERVLTTNRDKYARIFHAEYGGDSHVGRHTENPITGEGTIPADEGAEKANQVKVKNIANEGDWSESYMVNLFDWYLKTQETLDWFSGSAQWIFRDFGTPLRPENPIPYINQKGLVDLNGNKKDAYWVYKSYWTSTPKFCHIESHTWRFRTGHKNQPSPVKVFSNCEEVELFCNGVSQGKLLKDKSKYPASGLMWKVSFKEGRNNLIAKGWTDGKEVCSDSIGLGFSTLKIEKPDDVVFSQERLTNGNYLVTAQVVDKNGNPCVDMTQRMYFALLGAGKLIANYGTPTRTKGIQAANGRACIEVKTVPTEQTTIELRTQDLKGFYYSIKK